MTQGRKPIFFDERQGRWRTTRRVLDTLGVVLGLALGAFAYSAWKAPELPETPVRESRSGLHPGPQKAAKKVSNPRRGRRKRIATLGSVPEKYDPLRAAFYVPWDPTSLASLQQHFREIDVLMPEMLHAIKPDGSLRIENDVKLRAWQESAGVELPTMALVNNSDGTNWFTRELGEMLAGEKSRAWLVRQLVNYAMGTRQAGIVVDFEEVPDASQKHFVLFIRQLAAGLHDEAKVKLLVALPAADWAYDYKSVAQAADAIILMNYDQHWLTSKPGPIASQDWFARNIENILKRVPREKLIVAIANYTYDWTLPKAGKPKQPAVAASFQQAVITARESEATIEFDGDALNPHYSYYDEFDREHIAWMTDAVTAYNQLRAAERLGVHGTTLWRLGTEDASLWPIWAAVRADDAVRAKLQDVPPGDDLILEGQGDIWRIRATPENGRREFHYDASTDLIVGEAFTRTPLSYTIDQYGWAAHKVALTFDDGPDPRYTPAILDILREKNAPATFFVVGLAANNEPRLLRRIFDEGHEVGNHTATHPHFSDISRAQLKLELNITQRLIGSRLGIRSILFRPPFGIDHQPETAAEVAMLPVAQELGYVLVGSQIDPHDWGEPSGAVPAAADVIAKRTLDQALSGKGNIVLLHDGGGNRQHTLAALPKIIDGLRAAGFQIVPVSALMGQTRAQVMPPLTGDDWLLARTDAFLFGLFNWFRNGIAAVFIIGIVLVSGRAIIIGALALIEKMRSTQPRHPDFHPPTSVLIPAHNEEEGIVATVRTALDSEMPAGGPPLEVIVVDDGSTDRTAGRLHQHFDGEPRVRIVHQPNSGKAAALNRALAEATGEILITIDADTYVEPDAIPKLLRHFADPTITGVAGNVKVGNRGRWLTRWQALEYITSQNMEKRAFDLLNCITVVPGALGAWRASAVRAAGGISGDTVAEDTDLTIAMRRRGGRISYDEDAVAWTQAPETASALVNQRFRWTFGTMQAVWKHRDTLFRPKHGTLGWVALPNIFLFQILLPLVSPVIDLLFLVSVALWGFSRLHLGTLQLELWHSGDVQRSLIYLAAFMLIDLLTCMVAFVLERDEEWLLLLPLVLQRFYYRQMMYLVLFRAFVRAVQGSAVGWRGPQAEHPAEPQQAQTAHA